MHYHRLTDGADAAFLSMRNGFVREAKFVACGRMRSHFGANQRTASLGTEREHAEPTR